MTSSTRRARAAADNARGESGDVVVNPTTRRRERLDYPAGILVREDAEQQRRSRATRRATRRRWPPRALRPPAGCEHRRPRWAARVCTTSKRPGSVTGCKCRARPSVDRASAREPPPRQPQRWPRFRPDTRAPANSRPGYVLCTPRTSTSSGLERAAGTRQHLESHRHLLGHRRGRALDAHNARDARAPRWRGRRKTGSQPDRARTEDRRAGGPDDRRLLGGDLLERVAKDRCVVESDPGDDRNRGRRHARRVPSPPIPTSSTATSTPRSPEEPERRCSGQLELGEPDRASPAGRGGAPRPPATAAETASANCSSLTGPAPISMRSFTRVSSGLV